MNNSILDAALDNIRFLDGKLDDKCTSKLHDNWKYAGNTAYLWVLHIDDDTLTENKFNIALRYDGNIEREMYERLLDAFIDCTYHLKPEYKAEMIKRVVAFHELNKNFEQPIYNEEITLSPSRAHASREGQLPDSGKHKDTKEVSKILKERFEEYDIHVADMHVPSDGGDFSMILLFDYNQLDMNYTVWDDFCVMEAVIRHHDGLEGSFLFPIQDCAYTGRIIYETYGFHICSEEDVEKFIQWVIEEVRPKLTA